MSIKTTCTAILTFYVGATYSLMAGDLTLEQRLIIACYQADLNEVVRCCRAGANVNAQFGDLPDRNPFCDRWTGTVEIGSGSWTPLIALAAASPYPDPSDEPNYLSKDRTKADKLQKQISPDKIERRRQHLDSILFVLLSHKCDLDRDDGYGATALYKAVGNGKIQLARILLEFRANPNTKTMAYIDGANDITPLHAACNSKEMVKLLLDHGADALAKDSEGHTPADWISWNDERDFDLIVSNDGPYIRERRAKQEGK